MILKDISTRLVMPRTSAVLATIGRAGVIVGSWPRYRDAAKDLDLVIRAAPMGERNPTIRACLRLWPDYCRSSFMGHLFVSANPIGVELFESLGTLPPDDPAKHAGVLSYHQARRRAGLINAYGVPMLAVF